MKYKRLYHLCDMPIEPGKLFSWSIISRFNLPYCEITEFDEVEGTLCRISTENSISIPLTTDHLDAILDMIEIMFNLINPGFDISIVHSATGGKL